MARNAENLISRLGEAELQGITRIAERLLAGRPLRNSGHRPAPHRAGAGNEFLDFREFVPGDDLRNVDWRTSARGLRTQVRRFRDEASSDWYLCLDRSASMQIADADKWNLAAELTAAMAYILLNLGNRVGLLLFSDRVDAACPPGRGHAHFVTVVSTILSNPPANAGGGSSLDDCIKHMKPGASAMIFSDFMCADAMQSGLARIVRSNHLVHALLIASSKEFNLSFDGPMTLQDVESGERLAIAGTAGITDQAKAAWLNLQAELKTFCQQHGVALTAGWCEEPWKTAIVRHLSTLDMKHA
jgi:uncharacterized protein (DUF58 family)